MHRLDFGISSYRNKFCTKLYYECCVNLPEAGQKCATQTVGNTCGSGYLISVWFIEIILLYNITSRSVGSRMSVH